MVMRYKIEFSYSKGHIYDALNMKHTSKSYHIIYLCVTKCGRKTSYNIYELSSFHEEAQKKRNIFKSISYLIVGVVLKPYIEYYSHIGISN